MRLCHSRLGSFWAKSHAKVGLTRAWLQWIEHAHCCYVWQIGLRLIALLIFRSTEKTTEATKEAFLASCLVSIIALAGNDLKQF